MKKISISVVIPVFNSERFIGEAIGSILSQTLPPDEIIFADKNCIDGTRKIAPGSSAKKTPKSIDYAKQENQCLQK